MKELCAKFHCASRSMGMERIEHPLFYRVPIALRFEIGDPAPTVPVYLPDGRANQQYIESAFHRASTLFRSLPDTWDILRFDCYEGENFQELLKIVRAVTGLPAPHESASSSVEDKDLRLFSFYWNIVDSVFVCRLLREVIAADIGGHNALVSSVYWMNTRDSILFHLYDDRGCDIIGANKEMLHPIYVQYNDWLLDYDRTRMDERFAR